MSMLRDLLATWETWAARDTLARALGHDPSGEAEPAVTALDALRDSHELVELLTAWQWQAIWAARREGVSWETIGGVMRATAARARSGYVAALDRQEAALGRDVSAYRQVL